MKKLVYVEKNTKELRDKLLKIGYTPDQDWDDVILDMCTGIVLTPENKFYVTIDVTKPHEFECFNCFNNEEMFDIMSRYYQWDNLSQTEKNKWCGYCGCEGGCNLCENITGIYNRLLVKFGY